MKKFRGLLLMIIPMWVGAFMLRSIADSSWMQIPAVFTCVVLGIAGFFILLIDFEKYTS